MEVGDLICVLGRLSAFLRDTTERMEQLCSQLEPHRGQQLPVEVFAPATKNAKKAPVPPDGDVIRSVALELRELESRCMAGGISYSEIAGSVKALLENKSRGMNANAQKAVAKELGIEGVKSGKQAVEAVQARLERMRSGADDSQAIERSFRTSPA